MRIVIGEDEVLLRDAIARMLTGAGHEVVGMAGDGPGLVRRAATARPALVIADVRMPPTQRDEGLRAVREIRAARPGAPVLVISHHLQVRYAVELLALDVRATGYLLKQRLADSAQFLASIREIADGGTVLDPEVLSVMLARLRAAGRSAAELDLLTVARVAGAFVALGSDLRGRA
jgi:DNA-binding NarL/FixJ family response regulator